MEVKESNYFIIKINMVRTGRNRFVVLVFKMEICDGMFQRFLYMGVNFNV